VPAADRVLAGAARQHVRPAAADELVASRPAGDDVGPAPPFTRSFPSPATTTSAAQRCRRVIAAAKEHQIGARRARDVVVAVARGRRSR
jgi:hypothetical protein